MHNYCFYNLSFSFIPALTPNIPIGSNSLMISISNPKLRAISNAKAKSGLGSFNKTSQA